MRESLLEALAALVGYRVGDQTRLLLERALEHVARTLNVDPDTAAAQIASRTGPGWRAFTDVVAIHETYFFRHPEHFALLERFASDAAQRGAPLKTAWSVGCATGEEAWSLALTLHPHAPGLRVIGSDLSAEALNTARLARYSSRSFRDIPPTRKPGLVPNGAHWEVIDRVRERVTFAPLNLAADAVRPPAGMPGEVDVIFCRNVLVYLRPDVARRTFDSLVRCLAPGGLLVVNAIEVPAEVPGGLSLASADIPGAFVKADPPRDGRERRSPSGVHRVPARKLLSAEGGRERVLGEAQQLADEGRLAEALQRAAGIADDPAALYLSASIQLERGNLAEAGALLQRMLEVSPGSVPAHLQLALVAHRRGDRASLERHRSTLAQLLASRRDEDDLGVAGMKAAWARQVLAALGGKEAGA